MKEIQIESLDRNHKKISYIKDSKMYEFVEGDIDIVSSIKEILEKDGADISEIKNFTIKKGPGSFTGLKIGYTIKNVFSWIIGEKDIHAMEIPDYGREPEITSPKKRIKLI